jgi:hypothetical protein
MGRFTDCQDRSGMYLRRIIRNVNQGLASGRIVQPLLVALLLLLLVLLLLLLLER